MKNLAWSFLNSPKNGKWNFFNQIDMQGGEKKQKTWRGCFSQTKWVSKNSFLWMLWYLFLEHLWKTPPYRKKLHPKSEKKILQISQLFFGCCRVVRYLIFQFTFIFYELYWFLRWNVFLSCGIKQSKIDNCSFRPPQMYLEYLDTDKMRG